MDQSLGLPLDQSMEQPPELSLEQPLEPSLEQPLDPSMDPSLDQSQMYPVPTADPYAFSQAAQSFKSFQSMLEMADNMRMFKAIEMSELAEQVRLVRAAEDLRRIRDAELTSRMRAEMTALGSRGTPQPDLAESLAAQFARVIRTAMGASAGCSIASEAIPSTPSIPNFSDTDPDPAYSDADIAYSDADPAYSQAFSDADPAYSQDDPAFSQAEPVYSDYIAPNNSDNIAQVVNASSSSSLTDGSWEAMASKSVLREKFTQR